MSLKDELAALHRRLVVVVGGGRKYRDEARVWWALDGLQGAYGIARLAHGGAHGADTLAHAWAEQVGLEPEVFAVSEEEWARSGPSAGPRRSVAMLDAMKPDLVVAFAGGNGTGTLVREARKRRLRVWTVSPGEPAPKAKSKKER